jgi:hypothetical protein
MKEVNTVWRFSRERCQICGEPLDDNPIKINGICGLFDRVENNRKAIEDMVKSGEISKEDVR